MAATNFYNGDEWLVTSDILYIDITPLNVKNTVRFAAFLTAFQDNFKSNWQSQEVYGRMDPISTFKNTVRSISFSFDVPSYEPLEAAMNGAKIDAIIQGMYPTYKEGELDTSIIQTPPLFKVFLPNLIEDGVSKPLIGFFDSFAFKPKVDSGFFTETYKTLLDASIIQPEGSRFLKEKSDTDVISPGARYKSERVFILPKLLQVDIVFNILHDSPLGRNSNNLKPREKYLFNYTKTAGESTRPMYVFPHAYYDMFIDHPNDIGNNQPIFKKK